MTTEPLQLFRTFITESFTAVAVDIFSEVQTLVRSFEDENKRLRTLLDSALQPRVQLCRVDVGSSSLLAPRGLAPRGLAPRGLAPRGLAPRELAPRELAPRELAPRELAPRELTPEAKTWAEVEVLKEEQMECAISNKVPDLVKTEPDVVPISDMRSLCSSIKVSAPASVAESNSEDGENKGDQAETNEEEMSSAQPDVKEHCPPPQKTKLECPRFKKLDNTFLPTASEYKAFVSRLTELYKDTPMEQRPLVAHMGLNKDLQFVDCSLGKAPKGCPLCYHYPLPSESDFKPLDHAPPQPRLPLQSNVFPPSNIPILQPSELVVVTGMALTWETAYTLEQSTRQDKEFGAEVTNRRLIDCFKDVVMLKDDAEGSAERLVSELRHGKRKCRQAAVKQELRTEALRDYCRLVRVNWYPCGLVVHPCAPWLAAHPHGLVYDPNEEISFGIVRVKCERLRSFTECKFIVFRNGTLQVSFKNQYYWQIQGELMVTGTSWCDVLVQCREDMLVQRVYRDEAVISALKTKLDQFFFQSYLPGLHKCEED